MKIVKKSVYKGSYITDSFSYVEICAFRKFQVIKLNRYPIQTGQDRQNFMLINKKTILLS